MENKSNTGQKIVPISNKKKYYIIRRYTNSPSPFGLGQRI